MALTGPGQFFLSTLVSFFLSGRERDEPTKTSEARALLRFPAERAADAGARTGADLYIYIIRGDQDEKMKNKHHTGDHTHLLLLLLLPMSADHRY